MNKPAILKPISEIKRGMQDLVVDTTSVSWVDGIHGKLYYRGIDIQELAAFSSFEETAALLLYGVLPNQDRLTRFTWELQNLARPQEKVLRIIQELPQYAQPLNVLQTGLAALACLERSYDSSGPSNTVGSLLQIIAQTPIILAASYRRHLNAPILEPRNDLTFVENFFYMISGKIPSPRFAKILGTALILQMDHGFNSSTFTARAASSTLTSYFSAISAAVGALSGPLHGGASELLVEMLEDARASGDIRGYVKNLLNTGKRVMGMGHRVYKTVDPRAVIFKKFLEELTPKSEKNSDLEALSIIEQEASCFFREKNKPIHVNVDFWSGAVYKKIGLPSRLYPAVFAAARVVGWCAHILELRRDNRLYRPEAKYVGAIDLPYTPMEQREN